MEDTDVYMRRLQGLEPEWKDPSAKPKPQAKPQPERSESRVAKSRNAENSALVEAFNKKYGAIIKSGDLKGEDYDNAMALFKERWEAEQAGQKMPVRPGSALDRMARQEGYGKTVWRKREKDEYDTKPSDDQSPEARARRIEALNRSWNKVFGPAR